jgi:hypothetical protein
MTFLYGDFNTKAGKDNIFKPAVLNMSRHETSNDNWVTVANSAASNHRNVKSIMFQHSHDFINLYSFIKRETYSKDKS